MKKLLIATILLLTAFMASADSDYLPASSAVPLYTPSYAIGWIQLSTDNNGVILLYAPSILRVMETRLKPRSQSRTTIYMIDGSVVYVRDTMETVHKSLMPETQR